MIINRFLTAPARAIPVLTTSRYLFIAAGPAYCTDWFSRLVNRHPATARCSCVWTWQCSALWLFQYSSKANCRPFSIPRQSQSRSAARICKVPASALSNCPVDLDLQKNQFVKHRSSSSLPYNFSNSTPSSTLGKSSYTSISNSIKHSRLACLTSSSSLVRSSTSFLKSDSVF